MGVFSEDKRELTCIYNSGNNVDLQTLGYIKASEKKLNAIDITKDTITGTQWVELANRLDTNLNSLINFKEIDGNADSFSNEDCIKILSENPKALKGAIIFSNSKAKLITNPSKALDFIDGDSAGIEKHLNNG